MDTKKFKDYRIDVEKLEPLLEKNYWELSPADVRFIQEVATFAMLRQKANEFPNGASQWNVPGGISVQDDDEEGP